MADAGLRLFAARYLGCPPEDITPGELEPFRTAQRQPITVSVTNLARYTQLCDQLEPAAVRSAWNRCLHAITSAISTQDGFVDSIDGTRVIAGFGLPHRHNDHALRAILAALQQQDTYLQSAGKSKGPPRAPGCAIVTDLFVCTAIGADQHRRYSVLGTGVDLATRLAQLAGEGTILCSADTVASVLNHLPPGWNRQSTDICGPLPANVLRIKDFLATTSPNEQLDVCIGPAQAPAFRFYSLGRLDDQSGDQRAGCVSVVVPVADRRMRQALRYQSPTAQNGEDQIRRQVGRYRLTHCIGRGGMGEVWRALDPAGNDVAVKTILAGSAASRDEMDRFRREAAIMERLEHPHICPFLDYGDASGVTYIAMEYIQGVNLADVLQHSSHATSQTDPDSSSLGDLAANVFKGSSTVAPDSTSADHFAETALSPTPAHFQTTVGQSPKSTRALHVEQATAIMRTVAEAVQYAHENGVLHRDLKPGNIMLDLEGRVVVMDFGLAKVQSSGTRDLSFTGQFLGTLAYMAPEQASSAKDVDERADVFAIGAIWFELLTGEPHFKRSGNLTRDINRLANHEPPPVRSFLPDCDPNLSLIISKAMAPRLQARYANVEGLLQDIERWRRGARISAQAPTLFDRLLWVAERNRALTATLVASIVLLALMAILSLWHLEQRRAEAEKARQQAEDALLQVRREQQARHAAEAARADMEAQMQGDWHVVHTEDFSDTPSAVERWVMDPDQIQDGRAISRQGMHPHPGQLLVFRHPLPGGLRISFDATILSGSLDDISCFINGPDELLDSHQLMRQLPLQGYQFKIGGWGNSRSGILRAGKQLELIDHQPLEHNRTFRVAAERLEGELALWLDGELICRVQDPHPIPSTSAGVFGLSTWHAQVAWDNIRVERRRLPQKVDIGELAATLTDEGFYQAAVQTFRHAKMSALTMERLETLEADRRRAERHALYHRLAAEQTESLRQRWPEWSGAVEFRNGELYLHLDQLPITDLAALTGMTVHHLRISSIPLQSLAGLEGMPLHSLTVVGSDIDDLEPLRGMPLENLRINDGRIRTCAPLAGMPLSQLELADNNIEDLTGLEGAPLEEADLRRNAISSLEPLTGAPLRTLHIDENSITDLRPLAQSAQLEVVTVSDNQLTDCRGLEGKPLRVFEATRNRIESIAGLERGDFDNLDLSDNLVRDLSPLQGCPVESLTIYATLVDSLEALRDSGLRRLDIRSCPIADLNPLEDEQLERLDAWGTEIQDVSMLDLSRVTWLDLGQTPLTRLDLHAAGNLKTLLITGCQLADADALRLPEHDVRLLCNDLPWGPEGYRALARELEDLQPILAQEMAVLAALATSPPAFDQLPPGSLIPLSDGSQAVYVAELGSYAQAREQCTAAGTTVAIVQQHEDLQHLQQAIQDHSFGHAWVTVDPQMVAREATAFKGELDEDGTLISLRAVITNGDAGWQLIPRHLPEVMACYFLIVPDASQ